MKLTVEREREREKLIETEVEFGSNIDVLMLDDSRSLMMFDMKLIDIELFGETSVQW